MKNINDKYGSKYNIESFNFENYPSSSSAFFYKIDRTFNKNQIIILNYNSLNQNQRKYFEKNFSNYKIVYTEKNVSKDGRPIHFDLSNRKKLNQELMIDVYLLSKSKYFLYCFSNVSYLALIMGIHDFDKIDCVNI